MGELIGAFWGGSPDKRDLLLFDCFATVPASPELDYQLIEPDPRVVSTLWLSQHGLLMSVDEVEHPRGGQPLQDAVREWRETFERFPGRHRPIGEWGNHPEWLSVVDAQSRALAVRLRQVEQLNAVAMTVLSPEETAPIRGIEDVLHVVLKNLPMPDDRHTPEDIITFRQEAQRQGLLEPVIVWATEMASRGLCLSEVSEQVGDGAAAAVTAYIVKARERLGG
jgi:hypothetical protein